MAVDGPIRRIIVVLLVFLPIGVAASLVRGDSPGTTVGLALVGVVIAGLLIAYHWWDRRKN
jgi:hypothetical protein